MTMTFASSSTPNISLCSISRVKVLSLWILIQTSTSNGLLQDQYFGCFYDNSQQTSVPASVSNDEVLTIEKCLAHCRDRRTTYAALQNSNVCHCRDDYGVQLGLPDSTCNLPCSGNNSEICGGFMGQQIANSLYTVCPVGSYGIACRERCHCKRETPCNRMTGNCPDGCHGNWNGSACNLTTISQQYIGCYSDKQYSRTLEFCVYCDGKGDNNKNNTVESCIKSCTERNYSYAGLEYMWQCFCGDSDSKFVPNNRTNVCNMRCSGDNKTICGGISSLSVYSVCPIGNYGESCAGRCHCQDNKGCIYRNGSCPSSKCKSGWTGTSCNIRDCEKSNGDCNTDEKCSKINLTYSTVSLCRCSNGFQRNNLRENCTDIDECSFKLCDPETTTCKNTVGSYNCLCKHGFKTHNATACKDIDECQQDICDNSTTDCRNTQGSYKCSCKTGFNEFNGYNCTGYANIDEGTNVGVVVGSVFVVAVVVAIVLLLFYGHRKGYFTSRPKESNRSISTANDSTLKSSQEDNIINNAEQQGSHYNSCSSVTVKELPKVIQHKLSAQGVLEKEFKLVPMETKDPSIVGKNRDLKKKNRFRNIVPYDKNRVVLTQVGDVAFSDYINASVIKGYKDTDKVIATQGPLPETIDDFWRMVCENDVNVIVMITDLMENGKNKCAKYWPDVGKPLARKGIKVKSTSEDSWNGYSSRHFQVTKESKTWEVTHWHFLSYPDHGVPEDVAVFMSFLKKVRNSMLPGKCTVVHCSAGAGRTGTFIGIDYLIQQGNAEGQVDILGCLQNLRKQRPQMIQNLTQYQFVHSALLFEYTVGGTTLPCDSFAAKLNEMQKQDQNTGLSKLKAQWQSLEDKKDHGSKESKTRVSSKSIDKHRMTEMNVTFLKGWKEKDAYMALALPRSTAMDDFYSLAKEFNCAAIIFLDEKLGTVDSLFPTRDKPIILHSSTVHCDTASKEDYGTCYKILQTKVSEDVYANVSVYANTEAVSMRTEMTVLHVTNLVNSEFLDSSVLNSLYNGIKKLNAAKTGKPAIIMSRAGNSVSAFCLAALIAFEMIRNDKEVDIFQIVQGLQKSMPQFSFSLPSYKELYSVVGRYIELSSRLAAETISEEPVYEETR